MLSYAIVPLRRIGQVIQALSPYHITVIDKRGNPFEEAQVIVRAGGGQVFGYTDKDGLVTFPSLPEGDLEAVVVLKSGLKVTQKGNTNSDMFVELPVCAPVPFLSKTEIVVLLGGAALAGAGFLLKVNALEVVGELAVGGGIFSAIYRNSCGW